MREIKKYRVLDVREYSETIWNVMSKTTSSKHHCVLILEDVNNSKKRTRVDIGQEEVINPQYSEYLEVVFGDIIELTSEIDSHYIVKYSVKILQE